MLAESSVVTLRSVDDDMAPTFFTVDGRAIVELQHGSRVTIKRSEHCINLIRLDQRSFFSTLRKKLHWGSWSLFYKKGSIENRFYTPFINLLDEFLSEINLIDTDYLADFCGITSIGATSEVSGVEHDASAISPAADANTSSVFIILLFVLVC